jgi:tRNA1(Val) A37 N6-methylase TrmN6
VASREKDVLMLFRMLPINPAEFICVDLGSGKGRVLLLAAEFGFKKVVGVEFSPSLHRIAIANVNRYKSGSTRNCEIECVCQDAAEFSIPSENLVMFLYGPFYEPVFRKVVGKLQHSLEAQERPIYLINFGSPLAQAIRTVEFLQPLPGRAGRWIYSNRRHQEVSFAEQGIA